MKAADAIKLRFVHITAEGGYGGPEEDCCGIMKDGERCKQPRGTSFYGFWFCRRHRAAVAKWVSQLVFEDKEREP